jgi:aminopeptidase N
MGFIARVDDGNPKDIDYPYYVTAHEVAHQWWGNQLVPGDTRGASVLTETLAEYSALMVMKRNVGPAKMRRFLRYDLDKYLSGRAHEKRQELPLGDNENQAYLHYRKGSLAMYQLQDLLGEDQVNSVLRTLLQRHAQSGPPYASVTELTDGLRAITPPAQSGLIDDLFNSIVLFDNRALSATARKLPDGQYAVTLVVSAGKLRADGQGAERATALHDSIDIGLDDQNGNSLLRQRQLVSATDNTYTMTVAKLPARAGIDPDNKLIDRKPDDNMVPVELLP